MGHCRILCRLAILGLLASGGVRAQDPPMPDPAKRLSEFAYDSWTVRDGLPQNTIMALAQDRVGYLWLGTFNGLIRYDGVRFHRFKHPDLPVLERGATDLLAEADGTLWIGTQSQGLVRLGPDGNGQAYGTEQGLNHDIIWVIYRDPLGRLWVGTAGGLCQWSEEDIECLTEADGMPVAPTSGIRMSADGSLWVGTEGAGLIRFKDGRAERFETAAGQSVLRVQDLEIDHEGHLWVATFGAGLVQHDGESFRHWGSEHGLATPMVRSLLADPQGSLWVGTYGEGLQRFSNGHFDRLDSGSGLPNGHIQSLLIDAEGGFWFGTNGGLNRLRIAKFSTLSTREKLSGPFVRTVAEDAAGNLWVGTDNHGLNRIQDGQVTQVMGRPELDSASVRSLWPTADGGLWIGAYAGGLHWLPPGERQPEPGPPLGLGGEHIRALFQDARGTLWVGTDIDGLLALADGEILHHYRKGDVLASNDIRAIAETPDGGLWIGTYGQGLYRWTAETELQPLPHLPGAIVFAITFDPDGTAWIGTEAGLFRIDPGARQAQPVGLPWVSTAVFQILDDGLGRLWLCTNSAVIALSRDEARKRVQVFDSDHGMRSSQCNGASQPAGWRDRQGRLWFPTSDGVSWVDPARLISNPRPPPVVIQSVRIDGNENRVRSSTMDIPPGARRLEIDYAALSFISPGKQQYRYRLEGLDPDWIDAGPRRSAFYNDLPPGDYSFQVIAANSDGVWNTDGAHMAVAVLPLIHQTAWFRAGLALLVLGSVIGFIRWRVADLRRQKVALEQQVAERTQALKETNADLEHTLEELNQTQGQLVEAEKMASLGSLVAGVAHEINTPVGNSLTIVTHLSERCQDPHLCDGLNMIQQNLERAGHIVSRFKRIAVNKEKEARRRFFLVTVLSDARLGRAEEIERQGHHLTIDCPDDLEMDGYPEALFEMVTHLTSNSLAHAFESPGGTITISARGQDDRVVIEYSDDGAGIDETIRQRLFEPFSTRTRRTHVGLGMHIVYNIATRLLGGSVRCLEGPGARFVINLPANVAE